MYLKIIEGKSVITVFVPFFNGILLGEKTVVLKTIKPGPKPQLRKTGKWLGFKFKKGSTLLPLFTFHVVVV